MTAMKRLPLVAAALGLAMGLAVVHAPVTAQTDEVERHVAAAEAAAGPHHTRLFNYLCRAPGPRTRPRPAGGQTARPAVPTVPDVPDWHAEPAKVFDNLYFLGTRSLNSYAITTSAGIVIIDPLYDYNVEDEIVEGLRKLGLDPADITHVIVSHGHGDHYGGARLLQQRFGAQVLLSAPDWELILGDSRGQPKPDRDGVMTDGQELSIGDTRITFTHTPGHTPGTISTLVPVRDGGRSHVAALWGGTAMRPTREFYEEYTASAKKFATVVEAAGADVIISNHDIFDDAHRKIAALAERGAGDPHPFVIGTKATLNYLEMVQHCAAAGLARLDGAER